MLNLKKITVNKLYGHIISHVYISYHVIFNLQGCNSELVTYKSLTLLWCTSYPGQPSMIIPFLEQKHLTRRTQCHCHRRRWIDGCGQLPRHSFPSHSWVFFGGCLPSGPGTLRLPTNYPNWWSTNARQSDVHSRLGEF